MTIAPTCTRAIVVVDTAQQVGLPLGGAEQVDATVSQALRLLRAHDAVAADRDGRTMRYRLADPALAALLGLLGELLDELRSSSSGRSVLAYAFGGQYSGWSFS